MAQPPRRRLTAKQEAFALICATKSTTLSDAYRTVYDAAKMTKRSVWAESTRLRQNPLVARRIDEIRAQTTEKVQLTRAWVLEHLMENALECSGRKKVTITKDGEDIEVFKRDEAAANRALELLGKELRMFVDRKEIGGPGTFAELDEDQLDDFITGAMEELKTVSQSTDIVRH